MRFPALFQPAPEGGFVVTFRDVPEAITQGDSMDEAMDMAQDALITGLSFYSEKNQPMPIPSEALPGELMVEIPTEFFRS